MNPVNKNSLTKYCVDISNETPPSIRKNFLELEKTENMMYDRNETIRVIAKCIYLYIEQSQVIKGDEKVPRFFEFFELMQTESEKYNPSSLLGYTLNVISESGFVLCDLVNTQLVSMEESVFNPCQNIIKNYPLLNRFRYKLINNYTNLDGIQNKIKAGYKAEKNENHPIVNLHNLGVKFEENQKEVIKIFKNFIFKEELTIKKLLQMVEILNEYYKMCYFELDRAVETIKGRLSGFYRYPVFGTCLREHLKCAKTDISVVIHDCVAYIMNKGLNEQGIFRLPGNKVQVDKLVAAYDADIIIPPEFIPSVHTMCAILKQYLRSLPESLIFKECSSESIKELFKQTPIKQNERLKKILQELPRDYYANLKYLFRFLHEVSLRSEKNLMSPHNLGVVFGPSFVNGITLSDEEMIFISTATAPAVARMISEFKDFFPEDCELKCDKFIRIKIQSDTCMPLSKSNQSTIDSPIKEEIEESDEENSFVSPYYFTNPRAYEIYSKEKQP